MAVPPGEGEKEKKQAERPGASGMTLLYVLLLVPTFLLTIAVAVWDVLPLNLPASIQRLKPWRWGIVVAVALLAFVFLAMQLFTGFSLENRVQTNVERSVEDLKIRVPTTPDKEVAMLRGIGLSPLHRTAALDWVVCLHLLAVVCALLVFWTERRWAKPLPRIDVLW
jgi:cytoskeletal protein RodZ